MKIQTVSIDQLKSNTWNPNEMEDDIYKSLVTSIQKHGENVEDDEFDVQHAY
ncbi:hypothetical protein VQL36_08730 [Chengkuizengella sp. SCS-71B]|uniref:hypothetical protein n=1 Tax=Chengkuizengella sp. SCS-71B TaxID=3115290 RepID=UPI0032C24A24